MRFVSAVTAFDAPDARENIELWKRLVMRAAQKGASSPSYKYLGGSQRFVRVMRMVDGLGPDVSR